MSEPVVDPGRVAATFCATLADEWVRGGVGHVVVAPGSRSTPLALAVAREPALQVHVVLDERSAAFVALGIGRATGHPAVVVTTSGTAAAELHPAVVEAHQDGVPLICATADRPPELQGVGAPQTIEQPGLFAAAVRWAVDPGPPELATAAHWRALAARAVAEATGAGGRGPGPVHVNLAFREPLLGAPQALPAGRPDGRPWHERLPGGGAAVDALGAITDRLRDARGVIVAGGGCGAPHAVLELAEALGWPVFADPRSGARIVHRHVVAHVDQLLRAPAFAAAHLPEVVLHVGRPPASKVLGAWLAAADADRVVIDPHGTWADPDRTASSFVAGDPTAVCRALLAGGAKPAPAEWCGAWRRADDRAAAAIAGALAPSDQPTEPGIARAALAAVPAGGTLVVSSSMPVRDVEWFAAPREGVQVVANRGANGIDGVVSTAVGVALGSGAPTVVLVGDLAFLHDSNALLDLVTRNVDLTIVVTDNRGGGIFSFLPQGTELATAEFEQLFGTPQPVDLVALAAAHGLPATRATSEATIGEAVAAGGPRVVVLRTDRGVNVTVHELLSAAVVEAIGG